MLKSTQTIMTVDFANGSTLLSQPNFLTNQTFTLKVAPKSAKIATITLTLP